MRLRQYPGEEGAAYLELLDHPQNLTPGIVKRSVDIHGMIEGYVGPRLALHFDGEGFPVGLEILYASEDDEEI